MDDTDKYYCSVNEYINEFEKNKRNKCIQQKKFTIHDTYKKIPFKRYLVKILLDNPKVKIDNISLHKEAKQKLIDSLRRSGFDERILETRICSNCFCHQNYLKQINVDELNRLYL